MWDGHTKHEGYAPNPKKMKLKQGDITEILWSDKRNIQVLMNIHGAPTEGNFCNDQGNAIKPPIVVDSNHNMGYVH